MTPSPFVVDNSVVVAWGLGEGDRYADAVIDLLTEREAHVPSVWPLEFANVLVVAERRGRLSEADALRLRELVHALPIRVVPDSTARVLSNVVALARKHHLSAYDASYLDLAMREGLPIATLDGSLRRAAGSAGVPLVGGPSRRPR